MNFDEYTKKHGITLSDEQARACADTEGHVLLLAVPGSGKTTVMTARLGYLVRGLGVMPSEILAVTYSVAGAREMQKRYSRIFGCRDIEIRTINGFCAKLIMTYERIYEREAFTLIGNDAGMTSILRSLLREEGKFPTENELNDLKTAITYSRNMLLRDEDASKEFDIEGYDIGELLGKYRDFKKKNRLMDYDDQLLYGYSILCRYPEVRAAYSDKFRYICVDEAQDTSRLQHLIIAKAAEKYGNVFMVGDEDQSIYGFRAAYPEALLDFDKTYPDAKIYFISKNYRSTGKIVSAADKFISQNKKRRVKHPDTDNPDGEDIKRTVIPDLSRLTDYIRGEAISCARNNDDTAVLCRYNDSLIPIIDALTAENIPFRLKALNGLFFTHFIVTDIRDIFAFADNPCDTALFSRLYYKLSAGMNRADFEVAVRQNEGEVKAYPELISDSLLFGERVRTRMRSISLTLKKIAVSPPFKAIKIIMSDLGYGNYLTYKTDDQTKVNTLLAISSRFRRKEDFFSRLDELSEMVSNGFSSETGIILSTIHSAKGLEFDKVIVCDARDGILPSLTEPQTAAHYTESELLTLEEERRTFYVAVTRAKKQLELVTYKTMFGEGNAEWSYVDIIMSKRTPKPPREVLFTIDDMQKYNVGTAISHKAYGNGVITEKHGDFIYVKFEDSPDPKKLSLYVCLRNSIIKITPAVTENERKKHGKADNSLL